MSNAIVHYEEAKEHFPREFKDLVGMASLFIPEIDDTTGKLGKCDPMAMTLTSHQDLLSA